MDIVTSHCQKYIAVYTDSESGRIIIFDSFSTNQILNIYGTDINGYSMPRCVFSRDSRSIFATSDDYSIHCFDINSGKLINKLIGHTGIVRGLNQLDGTLVSCGYDGIVKIWK